MSRWHTFQNSLLNSLWVLSLLILEKWSIVIYLFTNPSKVNYRVLSKFSLYQALQSELLCFIFLPSLPKWTIVYYLFTLQSELLCFISLPCKVNCCVLSLYLPKWTIVFYLFTKPSKVNYCVLSFYQAFQSELLCIISLRSLAKWTFHFLLHPFIVWLLNFHLLWHALTV